MKKTITLLLTLLIIFGTVFTTFVFAYDADEYEGYKVYKTKHYVYTIKDGKAIIGYYKGKQSTVKVPSKLGGKSVSEFGRQLDVWDFMWDVGISGNKYVKKIVFPKSVKTIDPWSACRCSKLKSVIIKGAKTIYNSAFSECKNLKKISLPACLKTIEFEAFSNTALSGKFTIRKNVEEFDGDAIAGTKINRILVEKGNKKYSSKSGILYNKNKTVLCAYPCEKKGKTFKTFKKTKIIAALSFCEVKNLQTIIFSPQIQEIENCAIESASKLKKLVFKSKNNLTIQEDAFRDCKKVEKVLFKTKKEVTVEEAAFDNFRSLKEITLSKKIIKIGKKAFGYKYIKSGNIYKYVRIKGFTIKGYKGTAAENYAKKNKFKFVALKK